MQRSEATGERGADDAVRISLPTLDLRPPVRLEWWAATFAAGVVFTTVAPPLGVALLVASLIVAVAAALDVRFVPQEFRLAALLAPLFVGGGFVVAVLNSSASDPLAELASLEPGTVTVVGRVTSAPVSAGFGERADLRVESLTLDGQEVLRGVWPAPCGLIQLR